MLWKQKCMQKCLKSSIIKYCTAAVKAKVKKTAKASSGNGLSAAKKINMYFESSPHLQSIWNDVPPKYLTQKLHGLPENLYLVDLKIARDVVKQINPSLQKIDMTKHIICETNPGLGLITSLLLSSGIPKVRLYECCPNFRNMLKSLNETYPGRIELYVKDIFHMARFSYFDKKDKGNRVQQLLRNVPQNEWTEEPVMTIIGTMSSLLFMKYLFRMLALQSEIITKGRIQLFAIMKSEDFMKLTAAPNLSNLHVYKSSSIYFNNFFNYQLMSHYPRQAFLPWETLSKQANNVNCDYESMNLVRITMKKHLPLTTDQMLPYHYFVKYFFLKPSQRVIPTLENWIPGIGVHIIASKCDRIRGQAGMSIYTTFGQLNPTEFLSLFKIVFNHPLYMSSPLMPMFENQLLKSETVETDLAESAPCIIEDLEEKILPCVNK